MNKKWFNVLNGQLPPKQLWGKDLWCVIRGTYNDAIPKQKSPNYYEMVKYGQYKLYRCRVSLTGFYTTSYDRSMGHFPVQKFVIAWCDPLQKDCPYENDIEPVHVFVCWEEDKQKMKELFQSHPEFEQEYEMWYDD